MSHIIAFTVRRFNMSNTHNDKYIHLPVELDSNLSQEQFLKLKQALVAHLKAFKPLMIAPYEGVTEEGESDGFEADREETYNDVLEIITGAKTAKEMVFHRDINDGDDIDSEEPIYSGIEISIHPLDSL